MKEECIICKAPLIYLEKDEMMECVLCHKKELSKTRCEQGHYVCNECHTKGMDAIIEICLSETSKNPVEIIRRMMAQPFCHMHGPERIMLWLVQRSLLHIKMQVVRLICRKLCLK